MSANRQIEAAVAAAIAEELFWPTEETERAGVARLTEVIMARVSPLLPACGHRRVSHRHCATS